MEVAMSFSRFNVSVKFNAPPAQSSLRICAKSQAGRALFAISRSQRASTNGADRLRKYLARFGLDWEQLRGG
ncbi:MAG: hypothetical protein ACREPE_00795 [Lysobacter sp.]